MKLTFSILAIVGLFHSQSQCEPMPDARVEWTGAYLNDSKVGWSQFAFGSEGSYPPQLIQAGDFFSSQAEDGVPLLFSHSSLEVQAYGLPNRLEWEMKATLNTDLTLRRFEFHMVSDDSSIHLAGENKQNFIDISVQSGNTLTHEQVPLSSGGVYIAEAIPLVLAGAIGSGEKIDREMTVFEPHQLNCSIWKIRADGKESIPTRDGSRETYRIRQEIGGIHPVLWMDGGGSVYKEWAPLTEELGYLSFRESEEEAKDPTFMNPLLDQSDPVSDSKGSVPDLLYATCVRVPERIPQSDQVKRMVVDLWNFELAQPIPEGKWQKNLGRYREMTATAEFPIRLEIQSPNVESASTLLGVEWGDSVTAELGHYLEREPLVQVDHPEIQRLAGEVISEGSHPWENAVAIYRWIADNIQTEFRITLPSAVEVLETRKGDCNEQSTLFAALARAAGIPTKICTGLVYQNSGFYYHAWNEVLVSPEPEVWIPIDPALKQIRVDATHIKFGEGGLSDQSYLNGLIGKIRARIIEIDKYDSNSKPDQAFRPQDSG